MLFDSLTLPRHIYKAKFVERMGNYVLLGFSLHLS